MMRPLALATNSSDSPSSLNCRRMSLGRPNGCQRTFQSNSSKAFASVALDTTAVDIWSVMVVGFRIRRPGVFVDTAKRRAGWKGKGSRRKMAGAKRSRDSAVNQLAANQLAADALSYTAVLVLGRAHPTPPTRTKDHGERSGRGAA